VELMSIAGYLRLGTKIRKTEGFTLIEVIVAIAILSIISVALMQMFAVSARSNGKTYALDKANALCTETAEHFKADPGFPGAAESGFTPAPSETGTGTVYTSYLDRDFAYTEGPVPTGDSVYELDVTVTTRSAVTTTAFYYPDAAHVCTLQSSETNITLESTGSALKINVNGFGKPIDDPGKIIYRSGTSASTGASITAGDALIPIQLYWSSSATSSPKVKIINKVKTLSNAADEIYTAVADIYLCDVPPETSVTVEAKEGAVARQSLPVSTADLENVMYTAAIKITRLSDSSVLAENSAEKYWVN
jgi:prepilin-type N-terminal cleavage/methylation domain-containing protein